LIKNNKNRQRVEDPSPDPLLSPATGGFAPKTPTVWPPTSGLRVLFPFYEFMRYHTRNAPTFYYKS